MLTFIEPCMNVNRMVVFVVIGQTFHEAEMFHRNRTLQRESQIFLILLRIGPRRLPGVLLKRSLPTDHRRQPDRRLSLQKVHQHLIVISTQADHTLRILTTEFLHVLDTARRIRAAIDQIAEKNERVCFRISRQHIEQVEELRAPSVDVTNDESFHSVWFPGSPPRSLMPLINSRKRGSSCMSVQFGSVSNQR